MVPSARPGDRRARGDGRGRLDDGRAPPVDLGAADMSRPSRRRCRAGRGVVPAGSDPDGREPMSVSGWRWARPDPARHTPAPARCRVVRHRSDERRRPRRHRRWRGLRGCRSIDVGAGLRLGRSAPRPTSSGTRSWTRRRGDPGEPGRPADAGRPRDLAAQLRWRATGARSCRRSAPTTASVPPGATDLAWSEDGATLVVGSCGETACRYRLLDGADGQRRRSRTRRSARWSGVADGRLVTRRACRGLPCPIASTAISSGEVVALDDAAGLAVMARDDRGRSVVVHEVGADGRTLRSIRPAGDDRRSLPDPPTGLRLLPDAAWAGSAAEHPDGCDRVRPGWPGVSRRGRAERCSARSPPTPPPRWKR